MKLPENYQKIHKRITEIEIGVQEAIDVICKRDNYSVSYAEINTALGNVLTRNFSYEVRSLYKKEESIEH